jgi:hypothetical protein
VVTHAVQFTFSSFSKIRRVHFGSTPMAAYPRSAAIRRNRCGLSSVYCAVIEIDRCDQPREG